MGWPQPRTPIQTDNSTAVGVTNLTIVPRKTKAMDLRLWWLRCREAQEQFRFYWDKGSRNLVQPPNSRPSLYLMLTHTLDHSLRDLLSHSCNAEFTN